MREVAVVTKLVISRNEKEVIEDIIGMHDHPEKLFSDGKDLWDQIFQLRERLARAVDFFANDNGDRTCGDSKMSTYEKLKHILETAEVED